MSVSIASKASNIHHNGCMLSRASGAGVFVTPWTVAHQASLSVGNDLLETEKR